MTPTARRRRVSEPTLRPDPDGSWQSVPDVRHTFVPSLDDYDLGFDEDDEDDWSDVDEDNYDEESYP